MPATGVPATRRAFSFDRIRALPQERTCGSAPCARQSRAGPAPTAGRGSLCAERPVYCRQVMIGTVEMEFCGEPSIRRSE